MKLNQIQKGMGKIVATCKVVDKKEPREVTNKKTGQPNTICETTVRDCDGNQITLVLWNEEIGNVDVGDDIRIENGYCLEYEGIKKLTVGRFGKILKKQTTGDD